MPNVIRVHGGLFHAVSLLVVFLNFEIFLKECFSSAARKFIEERHTYKSEKTDGSKERRLLLTISN